MWEQVAKRSHKPIEIYSFGNGSDSVMLHGTVDYVLKDGRTTSTTWAARARFAKEDGYLKMDFYQVYLVWVSTTTPRLNASFIANSAIGHCCNVESKVNMTV